MQTFKHNCFFLKRLLTATIVQTNVSSLPLPQRGVTVDLKVEQQLPLYDNSIQSVAALLNVPTEADSISVEGPEKKQKTGLASALPIIVFPSVLVFGVPIAIFYGRVQQQYTKSLNDIKTWNEDQKTELVLVPVRIMGGPAVKSREELYIVAQDICVLIGIRAKNVAKAVKFINAQDGDGPLEKGQMYVKGQRKNGGTITRLLTVVSFRGVDNLVANNNTVLARAAFRWLSDQLTALLSQNFFQFNNSSNGIAN